MTIDVTTRELRELVGAAEKTPPEGQVQLSRAADGSLRATWEVDIGPGGAPPQTAHAVFRDGHLSEFRIEPS